MLKNIKFQKKYNYFLIVLFCGGICSIIAYGQNAIEQTSNPLKPAQTIPAMSFEERKRIYNVRVISAEDAWRCWKIKKKLEWASEDKMVDSLYKDKSIELHPIIQWARNFLKWPDGTEIKLLVEKGEENIYLILKPAMNNNHLRLWRSPYDITRRKPQRIDLLTEISLDDAMLESVVSEISSIKLTEKADIKNLPKTKNILAMLPLQDRFVALPWIVKAFSVKRYCRLIRIEFEFDSPRNPLLMQLFIGPKGLMLMIEGKKLETPSIIFEKKTTKTHYDPMTDMIGPPGGAPPRVLK